MLRPSKVWIIESSHHTLGKDGHFIDELSIQANEGFFLSQIDADQRADELNALLVEKFKKSEALRLSNHESKVETVRLFNREAAAIRAAGMKKEDIEEPRPPMARTIEEYKEYADHFSFRAVTMSLASEDH